MCKRKWQDKSSCEIFSDEWDLPEFDITWLNAESVSFFKDIRILPILAYMQLMCICLNADLLHTGSLIVKTV